MDININNSTLIFFWGELRIGFGTGIPKGKGCQGFKGPIPPPFFISIYKKELSAKIVFCRIKKQSIFNYFIDFIKSS